MIVALTLAVGIGVGPAGLKACATPVLAAVVAQAFRPAAPTADDISSSKLRIAWAEFKKLYDEGKVIVVDVRDEAGFAAGHIPKARLIPLEDVESRASELKKQKLPVVTYCS